MQARLSQSLSAPVKVITKRGGTEQLATREEHDSEFDTSLTCRLFAQRDLCGHLRIFPAFLCLSIRMWRVEWGTRHVMGR